MTRTLCTTAALLLAVGVLAACEAPADDDGNKTGTVDTGKKVDRSSDDTKPKAKAKAKPKGLFAGEWQILNNPKPFAEEYTGSYAMTIRVKNTSDRGRTAIMAVSVVKGDEVLGTLDCIGTGSETAAGQITTLNCVSTDDFKTGWTSIEYEDGGF